MNTLTLYLKMDFDSVYFFLVATYHVHQMDIFDKINKIIHTLFPIHLFYNHNTGKPFVRDS